MKHRIKIGDFLLAAEAILDVPAEQLRRVARLGMAESALLAPFASFGGHAFYPEPYVKVAVLCSRLIRNHPLPDGNKRVALVLTIEFVERNGRRWCPPAGGQQEIAQVIEWVADRTMSEEDLMDWMRDRIDPPTGE